MINLLPYSHRIQLKSLYKKRLIVVGLFFFAISILPLLFVLGFLSYFEYINVNYLNKQYSSLVNIQESGEVKNLLDNVKSINNKIDFLKKDIVSIKPVTSNIEKVLLLKPDDIKITAIDYAKTDKNNIININGVSATRDSILKYSDVLNVNKSGFCKNVNVPVDTYTKKSNVPFTITCDITYESK
jgi:hypothetical protein